MIKIENSKVPLRSFRKELTKRRFCRAKIERILLVYARMLTGTQKEENEETKLVREIFNHLENKIEFTTVLRWKK